MRNLLKQLGAKPAGEKLETNIFFDAPDSSLRKAGKGLRIRVAESPTGEKNCTITFKGPLQKSELKSREEIEFTASDPDAAQQLLEHLGYAPTLTFQKRRESWRLDDCKIELDTMPHLGTYVEIEGPGEKAVMAVREKLNLSADPLISSAYVSLLAKYLEEHAIRETFVRL